MEKLGTPAAIVYMYGLLALVLVNLWVNHRATAVRERHAPLDEDPTKWPVEYVLWELATWLMAYFVFSAIEVGLWWLGGWWRLGWAVAVVGAACAFVCVLALLMLLVAIWRGGGGGKKRRRRRFRARVVPRLGRLVVVPVR